MPIFNKVVLIGHLTQEESKMSDWGMAEEQKEALAAELLKNIGNPFGLNKDYKFRQERKRLENKAKKKEKKK